MTPMDRPYAQADMDAVLDCPELTDAQIANARPFVDVFPDLARAMRARPMSSTSTKSPPDGAQADS